MTWPMFNLITGAAREDAVVDEHFARVFNLDESIGDMMKSPRVIFGLLALQGQLDPRTAQGARSVSTRSRIRPARTGRPALRAG